MKTEKQILAKLKPFYGIEKFDYSQNPMPMGEWIMWKDKGWREALQWVLGIKNKV